jgi:hypothetical protein
LGASKTAIETFSVTSGGGTKTCTEDPNQAQCKTDYTLYIIGAIVLLGVGIIIYKVILVRKR